MLIIHITSEKLKSVLKRMGVVEAKDRRKAKGIERGGGLAFVNETRLEYEVRYILPWIKHLCKASKTWFKLRSGAVEKAIDLFRAGGSFLARVEKEDFLAGVVPKIIDKYEPIGDCSCEKAAKIKEIEELLEQFDDDPYHIDDYYTDLEWLLDLNPETAKPSVLAEKEK